MLSIFNPYISKVLIRNFRNFLNVEVELDHKQVVIGENNVGKTNFIRAIQLILDQSFSDNDRTLIESDFHDSLENPMINGDDIEISIEIRGYEHNSKLLAQFSDAVISDTPPTLKFTYLFRPTIDQFGNILQYDYLLFKGGNEEYRFTSEDRSYINIYVIKALRDVERELKANRQSPLYKLVKKYEVAKEELQEISEALSDAADEMLELDEIIHIKNTLQERFASLSGLQKDNEITLRTFDIDTERLLYNLQVYMGLKERPVSELSLGLANILYVSLMLILIKDRTIHPIIKPERFAELLKIDQDGLLVQLYEKSERGNFILSEDMTDEQAKILYTFMDSKNFQPQAFTILAIEEPEAHLHPILQRLLYREILHKSATSVIFTSHSTFIASVTPLKSIVHIRQIDDASEVFSSAKLIIPDQDQRDIERYVDAKRGELYFGKAIILVEGITEEYIIPAAADKLGRSLDDFGIVVCNINSTNFKPYIQLLDVLKIPWVLFTDGDYYEKRIVKNEKGEDKEKRIYHIMPTEGADQFFRGHDNISNLLVELGYVDAEDLPEDPSSQEELYNSNGVYLGYHTLEVDMMQKGKISRNIFKKVYAELITGGDEMRENFEEVIDNGEYWRALIKIEGNVSKGRFAQRLANYLTISMIPDYIKNGIESIIKIVKTKDE